MQDEALRKGPRKHGGMTSTLAAVGLPATVTAEQALAAAGVRAQHLDTLDAVRAAEALFVDVWQSPGTPPLTAELMRAVEHAGGYVVGAYDGERMIGASSGFLAMGPDGRCRLHSHISGVLAEAQGRRVGWALKQHQRSWALERGIETITWTFDPLVRRNAWFNLGKLGACAVEYLVDFYGPMEDGLNLGEPTDRLFTQWDLLSPGAVAAAAGRPVVPSVESAVLILDEKDGWPCATGTAHTSGPALIRLPADVERLRSTQPDAARAWRLAVRHALGPLLDVGGRADGLTPDGCLVVGT